MIQYDSNRWLNNRYQVLVIDHALGRFVKLKRYKGFVWISSRADPATGKWAGEGEIIDRATRVQEAGPLVSSRAFL